MIERDMNINFNATKQAVAQNVVTSSAHSYYEPDDKKQKAQETGSEPVDDAK